MKHFLLSSLLLACTSTFALASEPTIQDHYETVIVQDAYDVKVCKPKSSLQGGLEGALIGGLLGEAIGNKETRNGLGIFGAIVGANEAKKKQDCQIETRYNEREQVIYSHSSISFEYEGKIYNLTFQK